MIHDLIQRNHAVENQIPGTKMANNASRKNMGGPLREITAKNDSNVVLPVFGKQGLANSL